MSKTVMVTVTRRFSASPERVFDAWLDPALARQFLFATPSGEMVRTEIDPRVGGRFVCVDRRDGQDVEHLGEYVELDRPRRLVFDFRVPAYSAEATRVTVEITALSEGCEVTLTHDGVLEEYAERTQGGWSMILDNLGRAVGG